MSHRRTRRRKRAAQIAALTVGALAYGWQTHPVWTVLGVALAASAGITWRARRHRSTGRSGWIYHLPGHHRGALVYVGQTCWPERRMAQHQGLQGPASWFAGYVDFRRVEWYGPFPEADLDQIEADHIHTFEPWANKVRCEELRRPRLLRHETARAAA